MSSSSATSRHRMVEPLERRQLFSAVAHDASPAAEGVDLTPPTLVGVRIEGTPRDTTAVVLTFSEALDPVRAQRVSNYQISRARTRVLIDPFPDPDPFNDVILVDVRQTVRLDAAIYDDAAQTVTLIPREAFKSTVRMRRLRISSDGERGLTDAAGNRFDGNENGTPGGRGDYKLRFSEGRSVSYKEEDGDRVKLRLQGPGKVSVLRRLDEDGHIVGGAAQVSLTGGRSAASLLTGTVISGVRGDGVAVIPVVSNVDGATVAIAQDPAFVIGRVET